MSIGTKYCIKCGKPSIMFAGHLKGIQRMALGNFVNIKITAGWCSEECHDSMKSDDYGCFGIYDNSMEVIKYL
jgi:hypothetical protein